jgi:hypothetical protein
MNFLSGKTNGVTSRNFVKKNVLCEKGDEITRFDGTIYVHCTDFAGIPFLNDFCLSIRSQREHI